MIIQQHLILFITIWPIPMKQFNYFIYFFFTFLLDIPKIGTTNMNSGIISINIYKRIVSKTLIKN